MKKWHWILGGLGVLALIVFVTRRRHPFIGGAGYPGHPTTFYEAFKIAFMGAKYPEPINTNCGPGMVAQVDVLGGGVKCVPASQTAGIK